MSGLIPKPPVLSKATATKLLDLLAESSMSLPVALEIGGIWFPLGHAQVNKIQDEENGKDVSVYDLMIGAELKDLGEDEVVDQVPREALNALMAQLEAPPAAPAE